MKYRIVFSFLFCLFLLHVNSLKAQDGQYIEVRDLETWTGAQVKYEIDYRWTVGLKSQIRFDRNSSELESYLTEANARFNLSRQFSLGLGLRHIVKNDNEGNSQGIDYNFRYHLDAIYKHKIDRFDFEYRFRYQNRNEIGLLSDEGDVAVQNFRLKTGIGYNIKKWKFDPEFSAEIFNKYEKNGQSNGFDTFRLTFGTKYKIKGAGKIGLYYRMDQEISSFYPKTTNIILLNYSYTFKN